MEEEVPGGDNETYNSKDHLSWALPLALLGAFIHILSKVGAIDNSNMTACIRAICHILRIKGISPRSKSLLQGYKDINFRTKKQLLALLEKMKEWVEKLPDKP
jgi:uncharacterized membrane protein